MNKFFTFALGLSFALTAYPIDYPQSLDGMSMSLEYRVDTWEIFTNTQVDRVTFEATGDNIYRIKNFMGWYNDEYKIADPVASYDPATGTLAIESGQYIVSRYDYEWALCNMADEDYMNTLPILLKMDDDGIFRLVTTGTYEGSEYCSIGMVLVTVIPGDPEWGTEDEDSMLYLMRDPKIHPYNGSMSYSFVAQNGKAYSMTCDVYYEVNGNNVMLRNWSNTGFDYNVFFTINPEDKTLTATNQICLYDPDMLGECVLSEADAAGNVIMEGDNYLLKGTFENIEEGGVKKTVASFPVWGCFNEDNRNFFMPTVDTKVYFAYDITNPPTEGNGVEQTLFEHDATPEYFTLDGLRVKNPQKGLYIVRRGTKVSKEYLRF